MDQKIIKLLWYLGLITLVLGATLALGAVSYDYLLGHSVKVIGDSQLGAFFSSLAITLFGALLLQFVANEDLKEKIRAFEGINKDVKAARQSNIKKLFHPFGIIGALIGIGLMLGLIFKDYQAPLNFGIGPMQTLAIFSGSIVSIAGISFMSAANTFMTASMKPMLLQFKGLTKEEIVEKPKRKLKVKEEPAPDTAPQTVIETPSVAMAEATVTIPEPFIEPGPVAVETKVEETVADTPQPAPVEEIGYETTVPPSLEPEAPASPAVDVSVVPTETPSWSDTKAEEIALEALKEAEAELGLGTMEGDMAAGSASDTTEEPTPVPDVPPKKEAQVAPSDGSAEVEGPQLATQEAIVEVFECPNCHKAVGEDDEKCQNCGISFEEEEVDEAGGVVATVEEVASPELAQALKTEPELEPEPVPEPPTPKELERSPAPSPSPVPPSLPPPLPPPLPSSKKKSATMAEKDGPEPLSKLTVAKSKTLSSKSRSRSKSPSGDEEITGQGSSGILQSILDEITQKEDKSTKAEEQTPVEEDVASEVPSTCPNCGRKMKTRWRSCPFCGLEFR